MRHNIKLLKMKNYKSFIDEQEFDLSGASLGFYYIKGENKVQPRLGGNGVGKSNLIGAMCWTLFGKDQKGLIAGNIGNWKKAGDCEAYFKIDDTEYERGWKPNFFKINGSETEKDLTNLHVTYESFLYSVLIGQGSEQFFDMDPAEKLKLFTSILDLGCWNSYANEAKEVSKTYESRVEKLSYELENVKGKLDLLEKQDFKLSIQVWEEKHKIKIEELVDRQLTDVEEAEKIPPKLKQMEKVLANAEKKRSKAQSDLKKSGENLLEGIQEELAGVTVDYRMLSDKVGDKKAELAEVEDIYEDVCIRCRQPVSKEHIEEEKKTLKEEIEVLLEDLSAKRQKRTNLEKALADAKKQVDEKRAGFEELRDEVRELQYTLSEQSRSYKNMLSGIETLEEQIKALEDEQNPYSEQEKERVQQIKEMTKAVEKGNTVLEKEQAQADIAKYWVKAFRNVRLMIIEEACQELEILINDNMLALGLVDWGINVLVDRETKSKTIRKGFEIFVQSPDNVEFVPAKCFSGGEYSRLRLAVTFALIDFIQDRTGTSFDIEFYDEPTSWMSPQGINDLLELLKERAYQTRKRIFILDHRDFDTIEFDGTTVITKTEKGSIIK